MPFPGGEDGESIKTPNIEKDLCGTVGYPNQMLVLWCFGWTLLAQKAGQALTRKILKLKGSNQLYPPIQSCVKSGNWEWWNNQLSNQLSTN